VLPLSSALVTRLVVLIPLGAFGFLTVVLVLDRPLLKSLVAFGQSALGRAKRPVAQPGLVAGAP
jgi:hypothetical protein